VHPHLLNVEAGRGDHRHRIAVDVAAINKPPPQWIEDVLHRGTEDTRAADVLEQPHGRMRP
jgi:hypothetical protein